MRILGVDPGLTRCGLAVVDRGARPLQVTLHDVGVARSAADTEHSARVLHIADEVARWLGQYHPDVVAIEQVFVQRNLSNALGTAQVMGVVTLEAARRGLPVITYTPTQVKAAVTGHGGAAKDQVAQMVVRACGLTAAPTPADAADAAAVAVCHAWSGRGLTSMASSAAGASDAAPGGVGNGSGSKVRGVTTGSAAASGRGLQRGTGGETAAQQQWRAAASQARDVSWARKLSGK